jgi:hypothetical protein
MVEKEEKVKEVDELKKPYSFNHTWNFFPSEEKREFVIIYERWKFFQET